jgi:hypothetical protein
MATLIREAYISSDFLEGAAEVVLQDHPLGTRFVASHYWPESIGQLAGFIINANPQHNHTADETTFINSVSRALSRLLLLRQESRTSHTSASQRRIMIREPATCSSSILAIG